MVLSPGARLGPYEIVAPIGAGGMGEVYRARDSKLGREVAIKVLPARLSADADALGRFEREARAVAALSHPNILAIHDFGKEDGATFAVMELLEGEPLRSRLAAGTLPLRKALDYASQLAQGLAAAHEKGIVHRDLKPENVFVTKDGRVKILDFGLARQVAPGDDTTSPTMSRHTEPGAVLGTVGYMSPEQVRGHVADHRSDIFAFGAILYEMVGGRRAFQRDTSAETMTAILKDDPPDLQTPDASLTPALDRIVRHCLEKSPDERFQSVRDLAFALASVSSSSSPAIAGSAPPRRRFGWLAPLVLLAAAIGFMAGRRTAVPPAARAGSVAASFTQLTDQPGTERSPSLSPDGKTFVFVSDASGNQDIYLQRVGGHNPINLTKDSPRDDTAPAFSPDGEQIAFRSERGGGGIFVMGATGESVRRLADFGYNPSWSPDGKELVVGTAGIAGPLNRTTTGELWAVKVSTGEKRLITKGDAVQPSWSPHGSRIAYWAIEPASGQRDIFTVAADGKGGPVAVTQDRAMDWNPVWSPDGQYLYFASDRGGAMNLWRVPMDEASGGTRGEPESLTTPSPWSAGITLSKDGRQVAFATLLERSSLRKIAFDAEREKTVGSPAFILQVSRLIRDHDLSPDGQSIVFSTEGPREYLFSVHSDGTGYRQLTDDVFRYRAPRWSPDGKRISFYSNRSGHYEIWAMNPDGSGIERLSNLSETLWYPQWSPDGSRMVATNTKGTWLLDMSHGVPAVPKLLPPLTGGGISWATAWSPDGNSLAGVVLRSDGFFSEGVYVYSFASGQYRKLTDGGWQPVWLRDGNRLLYRQTAAISLCDTRSGQVRPVLDVTTGTEVYARLSISRDDRLITFVQISNEGDIWLMTLQ